MYNRFQKAALLLTVLAPALAIAQQQPARTAEPRREGSWEFSLGGGMLFLDTALRDFLGSGAPESRFANVATPGRGTPTAVARVGYNFTRHLGLSVSAGGAVGSGITYLNPTEALTYTMNLNAKTSPFVLIGTELTRISGDNDRVTHSTWGAHAGLGVRHMVGEKLALRLEGRMRIAGYDEVPMRTHTTYSPLVNLGVSYFVGGRKPDMVTAPPPTVVARVDTVHSVRVDTVVSVIPAAAHPGSTLLADQVVLRVQFRTDKAELLPISGPVLDVIAAAIKATPNSRWQVEGHTDSVGSASSNQVLSQARAQSVVDYLIGQGVDRGILTAAGFGPDRQVFSNSTAEGRAQNRRVQLRRIPPPPTAVVP
jgi:outer membrane protein OmpA-like peptidoglycan-associated protein